MKKAFMQKPFLHKIIPACLPFSPPFKIMSGNLRINQDLPVR